MHIKVALGLLALAIVSVQAKPSHTVDFPGVFDHLDLVPPVLPPSHFHAAAPAAGYPLSPHHHHQPHLHHAQLLPPPHFDPHPYLPAAHVHHLLPEPVHLPFAPASILPAPAPVLPPLLPAAAATLPVAPAPVLPSFLHADPLPPLPAPLIPAAPVPLLPAAPAPVLPAPVVHTETHIIHTPTPVVAPVLDTLPVIEPIPSYRAIAGPQTTTHHVSLGYAFPQPRLHAHLHGLPHKHLHAHTAAWPHHHHHHHHLHRRHHHHTLF